MNKIDMHFHTTHSDGNNTEEEILEHAQLKGLEFIALTDHDRVSIGFKDKAAQYGIKSVESVEISARNYDHKQSLHLTCYTQQFTKDVHDILEWIRDVRKDNLELQINALQKSGFQITMQDLYDFWVSKRRKINSINKYDIARIIYTSQVNKDIWIQINNGEDIWLNNFYCEYFKREWGKFSKFWVVVPEYEPSLDICKHIQESHDAILSIAHPNYTFKKGIWEFIEVLPHYIKNWGINALEINSSATIEWVQAIQEAAKEHDLFITFWSDNHEVWAPDNKHADFWELNSHVSDKFISDEIKKYSNKIWI